MKTAIIGLGNIGSRVAINLVGERYRSRTRLGEGASFRLESRQQG